MEYTRSALLQLPGQHLTFDENIGFSKESFSRFSRLKDAREVRVQGDGRYVDLEQRLYLHLHVTGIMTVGCDITGDPVDLDFDTESDEIFSFKAEDDIDIVGAQDGVIQLGPKIFELIMLEVPLKVVKPNLTEYPKGDGWAVVTEKEYEGEKHIDPRLAVLKEYKPHDE